MARIVLCRLGMSRKSPRFVPSGALVEITARVVGGRFLLTPTERINAGVRAVVGRALALCAVELHAIAFMSNHWHALISVMDASAASRFVQHVHSNIARLVHRVHGWDGSVFGKAGFIIVGGSAEDDRLRYMLSQGVKEGLVRRCVDWPGVHSARALLLEEVLVGQWPERRHERQIRSGGGNGGGREPLAGEVITRYPIDHVPLPSWRGLDVAERLQRVRAITNDIEAAARATYPAVLGSERVQRRDPMAKPASHKRSSAPPIHTHSEDERSTFTMDELAFLETFSAARDDLRAGRLALLPPGCFPPTTPFRTVGTAIWTASTGRPGSNAPSPRHGTLETMRTAEATP